MTDKLLDYSPARYDGKIDAMYEAENAESCWLPSPRRTVNGEWRARLDIEDKRNTERLEAYHERLSK